MPAVGFEIAEGYLFPHAPAILLSFNRRRIGNQQPRLFVALTPIGQSPARAPTTLGESLDLSTPLLPGMGDHAAKGDFASILQQQANSALDADQEMPIPSFYAPQQRGRGAQAAIGLDQDLVTF